MRFYWIIKNNVILSFILYFPPKRAHFNNMACMFYTLSKPLKMIFNNFCKDMFMDFVAHTQFKHFWNIHNSTLSNISM